jgi:hypothetical protein
MEIKIPLYLFVSHLSEVKLKRPDFPHLDELRWLVENFKFDDEFAEYDPLPEPFYEWWPRQARN